MSEYNWRDELRTVRQLEKGLRAEIVLQEEEGHSGGYGGWTEGRIQRYDPSYWVVDKPRITKPDTDKQLLSKNALELMAENSSPIIKYAAGKAIGVKKPSGFGYYPLRIFWEERHLLVRGKI